MISNNSVPVPPKTNMNPKPRTRAQKVLLLIMIAIEIFLTVFGFGFFTVGRISFTILHIPVIIATIMIGLPEGLLLSALFGFSSMITVYLRTVGPLDQLFRNPLLSVLPRLLIPIFVWVSLQTIRRAIDDNTLSSRMISGSFAAICGVISHTICVVTGIIVLYPFALGSMSSFSASTIIVSVIFALNMLVEILAAILAACIVILLFEKIDGQKKQENERTASPIRKTFQKWLFLFIVVTFSATLIFLYQILTKQDMENAQRLLLEKSTDIIVQISTENADVEGTDFSIGKEGYAFAAKDGLIYISGLQELAGKSLDEIFSDMDDFIPDQLFDASPNGISGCCVMAEKDGFQVFSFLPDTEIYAGRNGNSALLLICLLVLFLILYRHVSLLVQRHVVTKVQDVNASLSKIRGGDLDEKVAVSGNQEFEELSLGINMTVAALKHTMAEIEAKNRQEMEFAKDVQYSALPLAESVASENGEYEILGDMKTAREVGGDFFDYFRIGKDKLGVVIADVSGKGVPAALFMMTAKTLIKNFVLSGMNPAEALRSANIQLCENNEMDMFVTVWLGILDYANGILEFANAAHNPPVLKKAEQPFTYMDFKTYKRGFVLGGLEETKFWNQSIPFTAGDMLFLYTDGITEAINPEEELYGEERLKQCLEANFSLSPEELIRAIHSDIDAFVSGEEQFDDMTMVVLKMNK